MNFSTLTLSERERLAYAEGYTETAALLAEMADLEQERDKLRDRLDEVEFDLGKMTDARDSLIDERDELEDEMHKIRENRDEFEDQAKTYRAALMLALELLENPDADAFMADTVTAHLREVLA